MEKSKLHYFVNNKETTKKGFVKEIEDNSLELVDSINGLGISMVDYKKAKKLFNWCYRHIGSTYIVIYDGSNRSVQFKITRDVEKIINAYNKEQWLKEKGYDKQFEWDGVDLVDTSDYHTTSIIVGRNGIQESCLEKQINDYLKLKGGK